MTYSEIHYIEATAEAIKIYGRWQGPIESLARIVAGELNVEWPMVAHFLQQPLAAHRLKEHAISFWRGADGVWRGVDLTLPPPEIYFKEAFCCKCGLPVDGDPAEHLYSDEPPFEFIAVIHRGCRK